MALAPERRRAEFRQVQAIAADLYGSIAGMELMAATTPGELADSIAAIQAAAAKAYADVTAIVAARS